jgi:hypothetical protein
MAATYDPIATQTLGSAASSVTFSSIPSTYTDLVLVVNSARTTSNDSVSLEFNGDTGANYSRTILYGTGSSALSFRESNASLIEIGIQDASNSTNIFHIMNYANTTTNKTVIARANATTVRVSAGVGLWRNTAAITSIKLATGGSTFIAGSMFTLYGIKAA